VHMAVHMAVCLPSTGCDRWAPHSTLWLAENLSLKNVADSYCNPSQAREPNHMVHMPISHSLVLPKPPLQGTHTHTHAEADMRTCMERY